MENPQSVLDEVKSIVFTIFPEFDFEPVNRAFGDVVKLFRGEYPGYRKCNTGYHDLKHTTDAVLAMMRLTHGAILRGEALCQKHVTLGLLSSLFHDVGYIQTSDDDNELDLLRKTLGFYDMMGKRLANELGSVNRYMIYPFKARWNIDRDLYEEAIEKKRDHLKSILVDHEREYRDHLRRGGVVEKLDEEGV